MHRAFVDTSVILRILLNDDDLKRKASEKLLKEAKDRGVSLYLLPVAMMEIVFVLEKVYKLKRHNIQQLITALLNTPELSIEMEDVFGKAIKVYVEKNVKFADAMMAFWGLEKGMETIYTYDEKDFKRIQGLVVKTP